MKLVSSTTLSFDELPDFANTFSQTLKPSDTICLSGTLGSGKTTFLFFLMQSLKINSQTPFSSPTFSILNQYECDRFSINHLDLYRLNTYAEWEQLDLLSNITSTDQVNFIEWGDKFSELESVFNKRLEFEYLPDQPDVRIIRYYEREP